MIRGIQNHLGTIWWGAIFLIFNTRLTKKHRRANVCTNESFLRPFLVPRISLSFFPFFSPVFPAVPYKSAKILIFIALWEKNILSHSLFLSHTHIRTLSLSLSLAFSRERILPKRNDYHNAWRTLFFFSSPQFHFSRWYIIIDDTEKWSIIISSLKTRVHSSKGDILRNFLALVPLFLRSRTIVALYILDCVFLDARRKRSMISYVYELSIHICIYIHIYIYTYIWFGFETMIEDSFWN